MQSDIDTGQHSDLEPVEKDGFEFKDHGLGAVGSASPDASARVDFKRTWTPLRQNATIDFSISLLRGSTALCVVVYGTLSEVLEAQFLDMPTKRNETCSFAGGTRFKAAGEVNYGPICNCTFRSLGEDTKSRVRLTARIGLVQVAGLIVY